MTFSHLPRLLVPGGPSSLFILLLLSLSLFSVLYLLKRVGDSKRRIKSYLKEDSFSSMEEDMCFGASWREYQKTFVEVGDESLTQEEASTFFQKETLLARWVSLRYWRALPSLLIGIGILGTCIGLSLCVMNFESETTDVLLRGIEALLTCMVAALSTTIWGLMLSILFSIYEKHLFGSFFLWVDKLSQRLDERYRVSYWYLRECLQRREEEILKDLLLSCREEEKPPPSIEARAVHLSKESLESLNTLMAETMDKGSRASLEKIERLKEPLEGLSVDSMDRIVDRIGESTDRIIEVLGHTLSGITKREEEVEEKRLHIQEKLEESMRGIRGSIGLLIEELENSRVDRREHEERIERLLEQLDSSFKEQGTQLMRSHDSLEKVGYLFSGVEGFVERIEDSTKDLLVVSNLLKEGAGSLKEEMKVYFKEEKATLLQLEKDLHLSRDLIREYGERFGLIEEGLSSIFQEMETGLHVYSSRVKESLNMYLKDLSTNLEGALSGLSHVLLDLRDLFEAMEKRRE